MRSSVLDGGQASCLVHQASIASIESVAPIE